MRARSLSNNVIVLLAVCAYGVLFAASAGASAPSGGMEYGTGDVSMTRTIAGTVAQLQPDGLAAAPADAPAEVRNAVFAANKLIGKPYRLGGGHGRFNDSAYDCSGTVSYALHGAKLLRSPLDSGSFMRWGARGKGAWFTVYTNPGHAFVVIAGLRLDTSAAGDSGGLRGPRWRPALRSTRGYRARHPLGF